MYDLLRMGGMKWECVLVTFGMNELVTVRILSYFSFTTETHI